jgi:hypothetical protein
MSPSGEEANPDGLIPDDTPPTPNLSRHRSAKVTVTVRITGTGTPLSSVGV